MLNSLVPIAALVCFMLMPYTNGGLYAALALIALCRGAVWELIGLIRRFVTARIDELDVRGAIEEAKPALLNGLMQLSTLPYAAVRTADAIVRTLWRVYASHKNTVLVDFCMEIPDGGAIAVMGASGSGKTTLLRILLGLEKPNSGEILGLNNKRFAVVFQEDRLLQHRTARQNVEIPLIGTQIEKTNVHKIAGTALRDVELNGFEDFSVRELSGGMCRNSCYRQHQL